MLRNQLLPRLGILLVIVILIVGAVFGSSATRPASTSTTDTPAPGTTPTAPPPPTFEFPTVPANGTPLVTDRTYIHPSALLSLPHIVGWDVTGQDAQQTIMGASATEPSQVGITFINSPAYSVIHAYANLDSTRKTTTPEELDKYWDKAQNDGAWSNFTGGYKELNRNLGGGISTINFELYLDKKTYLARQVSHLEGDWLVVLRLVVPQNNPGLLDNLQNVISPQFHFWKESLSEPLNWGSVTDTVNGYVVRYPDSWSANGDPGTPYTASGKSGLYSFTLTTRVDLADPFGSNADAQAWVQKIVPTAKVLTIKSDTKSAGNNLGYSISYNYPDLDGNNRSGLMTVYNGGGKLFTINMQSTAREMNLLDDPVLTSIPEVDKIRTSFYRLPLTQLVPTPTTRPSFTPGPGTPTAAPATANSGGPTSTSTPTGTATSSTTSATQAATQNAF